MTKTAKQKAKQGLLLVNASDIDSIRNDGGAILQQSPVAEEDARSDATKPGVAKSPSSLMTAFASKRPAQKDDGFGFFALMLMSLQSGGQNLPAPRVS